MQSSAASGHTDIQSRSFPSLKDSINNSNSIAPDCTVSEWARNIDTKTMMAAPSTKVDTATAPRRRRDRSNFLWFRNSDSKAVDQLQPSSRVLRRSSVDSGSGEEMNNSRRRGAMTPLDAFRYTSHMVDLETETNAKDWLKSLARLDPRRQILDFFNDVALEGVDHYESHGGIDTEDFSKACPNLLRAFTKNGMFTVWRPTSPDAIRKMITGEGTGKGLDIKGKSAQRGVYSGYVPFLQISENEHKHDVGSMSAHKRVRIFYPNKVSRDASRKKLAGISRAIMMHQSKPRKSATFDGFEVTLKISMNDLRVYEIDDYAEGHGMYGIDVPELLLWEGYVMPADIRRPEGSKYDTGRVSMPEFQQMNIDTLRSWKGDTSDVFHLEGDDDDNNQEADPRPVLWHAGCGHKNDTDLKNHNPLCPQGLLMAYEENGKVTPVVSDFDCFLLGTRGVKYSQPLGEMELSMLSWCIDEIDGILSNPKEGMSWTVRWLEVKKKLMRAQMKHMEMPKFGYADPRSYSIIKGAVGRLKGNGAVRHGPECFNYAFPQELDTHFLVVSDTFPEVPWRYVGEEELRDILSEKIDEGFTFPLNPKWILCDEGWRCVYDKLLASQMPNVQDSINIWYPPKIRERIDKISSRHPRCFDNVVEEESDDEDEISVGGTKVPSRRAMFMSNKTRLTLAEFELKKYLQRLSSNVKDEVDKLNHSLTVRDALEGINLEELSDEDFFEDDF